MKNFTLALLMTFVASPLYAADLDTALNWHILQQGTGFSIDTASGLSERKGIRRENLVSVSRSGDNILESYWEAGAFRATVTYNRKIIVDGYDISDVSRINSFRFDKSGSTVYIRTTKGPKAVVELYQNGRPILKWPRLSLVNILGYRKENVFISVYVDKTQFTQFWRFPRDQNGKISTKGIRIGELAACSVLSSKVVNTGIALAAYCDSDRGSDVKFLDFETGRITDIRATEKDEFLAYSWAKYQNGTVPVLSVSGNNNGRQFFHAVSGSLLRNLGEPMSVGSDESGKQSWSQSYRTRTLAELYRKTQHSVFSALATRAMTNTLDQSNGQLNIVGDYNPSSAWASRIYSADGKTPISFMINQAMISASLIASCRSLAMKCSVRLKGRIDHNAQQLVRAYEQWYDDETGFYHIPYGANFRFDGMWAPWNWHMMWVPVLRHVGEVSDNEALVTRANRLAKAFVDSWEIVDKAKPNAFWRYWPKPYYAGWTKKDKISKSRPKQKPKIMSKERYEDINHAGISLLGLADAKYQFTYNQRIAAQQTLIDLQQQKPFLARDLDGKGPVSPRWLPGAGWHIFRDQNFEEFYAKKLPGSISSDQHLAYALLFDPLEAFRLELSLAQCSNNNCLEKESWKYENARQFLASNPLVKLKVVQPVRE
ncbi:MAG: hypothetical protein V7723_04815 [Sneathiella sp.]|uniref:hypothetical protein n=1 Tax=Sneathiella sp. TaxID=1964365 RepID=UPI003001520C